MPCDDVDPDELSSLERRLLLYLPSVDDEQDFAPESQTFDHLGKAVGMSREEVENAAVRLHELELVDIGYRLDPDDSLYVPNNARLTDKGLHMATRLSAMQ